MIFAEAKTNGNRIQRNVELKRIKLLYFQNDYSDAQCIHIMPYRAFHGKGAEMSEERAVYRVQADRPPLAGALEPVFQSVAAAPTGEAGRVLALFAFSLVEGEPFDLSQIERLPESAQALCLTLFEYCLTVGLTEEERRAASAAFAPFVAMYASGARH